MIWSNFRENIDHLLTWSDDACQASNNAGNGSLEKQVFLTARAQGDRSLRS